MIRNTGYGFSSWEELSHEQIIYDYASPNLIEVSPDRLLNKFREKDLLFNQQFLRGVVFIILSQLFQLGKCSFVCIGQSAEEVQLLLQDSLYVLGCSAIIK